VHRCWAKGLRQGLLFGVAAGAGAALIRDRLDHVFHSAVGSAVNELKGAANWVTFPTISCFSKGLRRDKALPVQRLDAQQTGHGGYQRFTLSRSLP